MTLDDFFALQQEPGQTLLAQLAGEPLDSDAVLRVLERYRKDYPTPLVSAAVELTQLRRKAAVKFPEAPKLFFTRDGLEMASGAVVARHTAHRFAGMGRVLDLCCGIGGETLALTEVAQQVIAVDSDPLTLEMARANARALAVEKLVDLVQADVTQFVPSGLLLLGHIEGIFIDPSRRAVAGAARRPEDYAPPLSWCLGLSRVCPRVAVKVSPALDYEAALRGVRAEVEIISLDGECKEAILWLAEFRTCARRATLLPGGATLTDDGPSSDALGEIGAWVYEPDGAVIRAHLVQRLAGECGLRRIEPDIAYLTGDAEVNSPFLTGYAVRAVIPWSLKRLNAALAAHGIGQVVIKKRGFPLTPEALRPKLKLPGWDRAILMCTKALGKPVVIIAAPR